jgi:protein arginine N-methyltransferase 2
VQTHPEPGIFFCLEEPLDSIKQLIASGGAPLWYQNESEGTSRLFPAGVNQTSGERNIMPACCCLCPRSRTCQPPYTGRRRLECRYVQVIQFSSPMFIPLSVDYLGSTAGDIALSFNNEDIYMIIRDAGIRAGAMSGR